MRAGSPAALGIAHRNRGNPAADDHGFFLGHVLQALTGDLFQVGRDPVGRVVLVRIHDQGAGGPDNRGLFKGFVLKDLQGHVFTENR